MLYPVWVYRQLGGKIMARLQSEDKEYKSCLEILPGKSVELDSLGESWQFFSLKLSHGERVLHYQSPSEEKQDYTGFIKDIKQVADGYLLCRKPKDEIAALAALLQSLADGKLSKAGFEPVEPSFELLVERQHEDEFRLNVWVDEGNVLTTIARWDAIGLRFFTTQGNLLAFIDELKRDFAC